MEKGPGEKLGMSIKGGVKSYAANPRDRTDEGIFISRVSPASGWELRLVKQRKFFCIL